MTRAAALVLALACVPTTGAEVLRIGVTMPAYYSWVAALTEGVPAEVTPIVPAGVDPHGFQPGPAEALRLGAVDLLVRNQLGHDRFLDPLLASLPGPGPETVDLHRGVPLLESFPGGAHSHDGGEPHVHGVTNPHTFLSLTAAAQQVHNLARALAAALPDHAGKIHRNARAYAREVRRLHAETAAPLLRAGPFHVATVHDGYAYFLQELGVQVVLVVQPRHGLEPSAQELADVLDALRAAAVDALFTEADFPPRYAALLARDAGVRVRALGHVTGGGYTKDRFLEEMAANTRAVRAALLGDP